MPGELVFIGLGLQDEYGLSLRGQAVAKSCDFLFTESYTSLMPGLRAANLEKIVGREVKSLSRREVEETPEKLILAKAETHRVGFLVPGDPMVATTHVDLRLRANKAGIKTSIVHAASVITAAAGATGLQSYKFGRTVTIPASPPDELPESVYKSIMNNLVSGLHTLILLEIDVENKRYVSIPLAIKRLLTYSEIKHESTIEPATLSVGIARLEAPDMIVKAGTVSELAKSNFGEPPYVLIVPGPLHFVEAEALQIFCGARKEVTNPK